MDSSTEISDREALARRWSRRTQRWWLPLALAGILTVMLGVSGEMRPMTIPLLAVPLLGAFTAGFLFNDRLREQRLRPRPSIFKTWIDIVRKNDLTEQWPYI